jgi:tetratricopeptide (TPR) repeat protein
MQPKKTMRIFIYLGVTALVLCSPVSAKAFVDHDRIAMAKSLAHYAMGFRYDLLGQLNRAVLEYEKAAQFDEGGYLIQLRMGTDYARLNMLSDAIDHLTRVPQLNPEDLQSHYLLALIYSNQKEYDKAAREYEFILKTFAAAEPQNIEIYGYLGQLYYSQRKYDQAIEQFEKILALEPKNADVMYMLGSLYVELGRRDKAMDILKQSISVDSDHDGSLNTLGYLYAEEGKNLDEAMEMIQRAININPANGAYLDSLGWVYYKKGMHEKALEVLTSADSLLKDPVIHDHLGDVYFKLNRAEDAMKYWNLSLEALPGQEEVLKKIEGVKNTQVRRNSQ